MNPINLLRDLQSIVNDPTSMPSPKPIPAPTFSPTAAPSLQPTSRPSCKPTPSPTWMPTFKPTWAPSSLPTTQPSCQPSSQPSVTPSNIPSSQPSSQPSAQPFAKPTGQPSSQPVDAPSSQPTGYPSSQPTCVPTLRPSSQPTRQPTSQPTRQPISRPSGQPTSQPISKPSSQPSCQPTTQPTSQPSSQPSRQPFSRPTGQPSRNPTSQPSRQPTRQPTAQPSLQPFAVPTGQPTRMPSSQPTRQPTSQPTSKPSIPTNQPTSQPSRMPSRQPTAQPSRQPTGQPTLQPITTPTSQPSVQPTSQPSRQPTGQPSRQPTSQPSRQPSRQPTRQPTSQPTSRPSMQPSIQPTSRPSMQPTGIPTMQPSIQPTSLPTMQPSTIPTRQPTSQPSMQPSLQPVGFPTGIPSIQPTCQPTGQPTTQPSCQPSIQPTSRPTMQPSSQPSNRPSSQPSRQPTTQPTTNPTAVPTTSRPTSCPTTGPTKYPSTSCPTSRGMTNKPSARPTSRPSVMYSDYEDSNSYPSFLNNMAAIRREADAAKLNSVYYNAFYYKGKTMIGRSEWTDFIQNTLLLPFDGLYFSGLKLTFGAENLDLGRVAVQSYYCDSPSVIKEIVKALNTGTFYTQSCNNDDWRVYTCDNIGPVLCVNCKKSCSSTSCPVLTPYIVNPTRSDCYNKLAGFNNVRFDVSRIALYPVLRSLPTATASQSSINVRLNVSLAGRYYCKALPFGKQFNSIFDIKLTGAGNSSLTNPKSPISVVIYGLNAETKYDIYCYTEDFRSNFMDLSTVLRNKITVTTTCCRQIVFGLNRAVMFLNDQIPPPLHLSLNSQPKYRTIVSITAQKLQASNSQCSLPSSFSKLITATAKSSNLVLRPNSIQFSNISSVLDNTFSFIPVVGCFLLSASSSTKNSVYTSSSMVLVILPSSAMNLVVPTIQSAQFSNDGLFVQVKFTFPTDRGSAVISGYNGVFSCNELFYFSKSYLANCQWTDDQSLSISYRNPSVNSTDKITIGDSILLKSSILQSKLGNSSIVDYLSTSSLTQSIVNVTIKAPITGVVPRVTLSTQTIVTRCSGITIDLSSSIGSGGRDWASMIWTVTSTDVDATPITAYLNSTYQSTKDLVVIPESMLTNTTYTIQLASTNFLQITNIASITITVLPDAKVVPTAVILGPSFVSINRDQELVLRATGSYPKACKLPGTYNNSKLTYKWNLYEEFVHLSTFVSDSIDPRVFRVKPLTLKDSTKYRVEVVVFVNMSEQGVVPLPSNMRLSKSAVIIEVLKAPLIAVISGGSTRTISSNDSVVQFDARRSYDSNMLQVNNEINKNLTYVWRCVQLNTTFNASCPPLHGSASSLASLHNTDGKSLQIGQILNISMTVNNKIDGRTATSFVIVTVVGSLVPVISIEPMLTKININQRIIINASVYSQLTDSMQLEWKSATSNLNMSALVISDPTVTFQGNGLYLFPLALKPLLNIASSCEKQYTFRLFARYVVKSYNSENASIETALDFAMSSITVRVNNPPFGGSFEVTPTTGKAYYTLFTFKAFDWIDDLDDLPLSYAFSYVTNFNNVTKQLYLQSRSSNPFLQSQFNFGNPYNNYQLIATLEIFDSLLAFSNTSQTFQVFENTQVTATSLLNSITESWRSADFNKINQMSYDLAFTVNTKSVNCTVPKRCSVLNRNPCNTQSNTCGRCLDGFISTEFDYGNSLCVAQDSVKSVGSTCNYNYECYSMNCTKVSQLSNIREATNGLFDDRFGIHRSLLNRKICVKNIRIAGKATPKPVLEPTIKACPNNCSDIGTCLYYDRYGSEISRCMLTDFGCTAKCSCPYDKYGPDCSMKNTTFFANQVSKEKICSNLYSLFTTQETTSDAIISRANTVIELFRNSEDVSDQALSDCSNVIIETISEYNSFCGSDETSGVLAEAISSLLKVGQRISSGILDDLYLAMHNLADARLDAIAFSETGLEFASDELRVSNQKLSIGALMHLSSVNLSLPLTTVESFYATIQPTVSFSVKYLDDVKYNTSDTQLSDIVGLTTFQFVKNPRNVRSNSTSIRIYRRYHSSDGSGELVPLMSEVTLVNKQAIPYVDRPVYNVSYDCKPVKDAYIGTATCPDGTLVNVTCPGQYYYGFIYVNCASLKTHPRCTKFDSTLDAFVEDDSCSAVSYVSTETTCQCMSDSEEPVRRSLSATLSGFYEFTDEYSTEMIVTMSEIEATWLSKGILYIEPVLYNTNLFYASVGFFALLLFGVVMFLMWDVYDYYLFQSKKAKNIEESGANKYFMNIRTFESFFKKLIPRTINTKYTMYQLFWKKMAVEHDYFVIFGLSKYFKKKKKPSNPEQRVPYSLDPPIPFEEEEYNPDGTVKKKSKKKKKMSEEELYAYSGYALPGRSGKFTTTPAQSLSQGIKDRPEDEDEEYNESPEFVNYRVLRWMIAISRILCFIFADAVFLSLYFADDGTCQTYITEEDCLAPMSFDMRQQLCEWHAPFRSCAFHEPDDKFLPSLLLAAIITIVTIPFDKIMRVSIEYIALIPKLNLREKVFAFLKKKDAKIEDMDPLDDKKHLTPPVQLAVAEPIAEPNPYLAPGYSPKKTSNSALALITGSANQQPDDSSMDLRKTRFLSQRERDFGDELKVVQWSYATLIRGARMFKMRSEMDFVTPEEELRLLMLQSTHEVWRQRDKYQSVSNNLLKALDFTLRSMNFQAIDIGDPKTAASLIKHGEFGARQVITQKLLRSRRRAEEIKSVLLRLTDDSDRDLYILRRFLTDSMPGAKRIIACHTLFGKQDAFAFRTKYWYLVYFAFLAVPAVLLVTVVVTVVLSRSIGAKATGIGINAAGIAIILDVFIFQPTSIAIKHVLILSLINEELYALHDTLSRRAKTLLTRRRNVMFNVQALVQHFNPACRVARSFPWLPSSRILTAITDYDLPIAHRLTTSAENAPPYNILNSNTPSPLFSDRFYIMRKNFAIRYRFFSFLFKNNVIKFCSFMLFWFMHLSDEVQQGIVDLVATVLWSCYFLALIYSSYSSITITFAIIIATGSLILFLRFKHLFHIESREEKLEKLRKENHRKKRILNRLKSQFSKEDVNWTDLLPLHSNELYSDKMLKQFGASVEKGFRLDKSREEYNHFKYNGEHPDTMDPKNVTYPSFFTMQVPMETPVVDAVMSGLKEEIFHKDDEQVDDDLNKDVDGTDADGNKLQKGVEIASVEADPNLGKPVTKKAEVIVVKSKFRVLDGPPVAGNTSTTTTNNNITNNNIANNNTAKVTSRAPSTGKSKSTANDNINVSANRSSPSELPPNQSSSNRDQIKSSSAKVEVPSLAMETLPFSKRPASQENNAVNVQEHSAADVSMDDEAVPIRTVNNSNNYNNNINNNNGKRRQRRMIPRSNRRFQLGHSGTTMTSGPGLAEESTVISPRTDAFSSPIKELEALESATNHVKHGQYQQTERVKQVPIESETLLLPIQCTLSEVPAMRYLSPERRDVLVPRSLYVPPSSSVMSRAASSMMRDINVNANLNDTSMSHSERYQRNTRSRSRLRHDTSFEVERDQESALVIDSDELEKKNNTLTRFTQTMVMNDTLDRMRPNEGTAVIRDQRHHQHHQQHQFHRGNSAAVPGHTIRSEDDFKQKFPLWH